MNCFRMRQVFPSILVIALLLAAFSSAASTPPLRIMPLGDSITDGVGAVGGYRAPLHSLLTAAGYNVDFVGTLQDNGTTDLPDWDHEGHPGWRIDQIDSMILGAFDRVEDPDVILLLIGTNDYGTGYDTAHAANRLESLIARMATNRPHAKIIVANLLERGEPYNTQIQTTFNPYLPGIVSRQRNLGREVYFDDLRSAVPLADIPDQLHPGAQGYRKMANNWFATITNHFSPQGSTNVPAISRVYGGPGLTNVVVVFSKPVGPGATTLANYALSGGLVIQGATLDAVDQRKVTLSTSLHAPASAYTLTVSGIRDLTPAQRQIASNSIAVFESSPLPGALANVPESTNYSLVYSLNIPNQPSYPANATYDVDLRAFVSSYERVAYYLELVPTNGQARKFVWVSMNPFSLDVNKIGVPTAGSGAVFTQAVSGLNVVSSDPGIVEGINLAGGHIEFFPYNYTAANSRGVVNASASQFDWGDAASDRGNYGSMQIANADASQMLLSFNHWGGGANVADVGIGNGFSNPDWTFSASAPSYAMKTLQVYVQPTSLIGAPQLVKAVGKEGLTNIVVTFSKALDDGATNVANYAVNGGLSVAKAELDPGTRLLVTLTTTAQVPSTSYTVTVKNVTGLQSHTPIALDSMTTFKSAPKGRGGVNNVPEAANYALVYSLNIPDSPSYQSNATYTLDLHASHTNFTRIAYYLELQRSGELLDYVWVSMNAFTADLTKIGIPTLNSGASYQQMVTSMNVASSVPGIVTGTNLAGGSLEFWRGNYTPANAFGIPNASTSAYDWGDTLQSGNYGCMQIANSAASQMLLSFNRWGGIGGLCDLGIGNGSGTSLDWTFAQNASSYTVKTLQVFVLPPTNANPPAILSAVGAVGWTNVVLTFDRAVDDNAVVAGCYAISGGVDVLDAKLDSVTRHAVTLTTTQQKPGSNYLVTISGVSDYQNHIPVASGTTINLTSAPARGGFNNIAEAGSYQLVYSLDIPNNANYAGAMTYAVNNAGSVTSFSRVAYYLELQAVSGPLNYVWVSMNAFTTNVNRIGVPTASSGAWFQQYVSDLNVYSSVSGVVTGVGLTGGVLEFWPGNYKTDNALGVPNASGSAYDWGDTLISGDYGSMQIGRWPASQMLLSFNRWGGSVGAIDVGIGNGPGTSPDWTFSGTAPNCVVKTLQVYVLSEAGPFNLLSPQRTDGLFTLHWESTPGRHYTVWFKPVLDATAWVRVGEQVATANTAAFTDAQAPSVSGFYQITTP